MTRPLDGIRVLDLGISTAGPYAARFLGDLGADVIKVEPLDGENARKLGLRYGGTSYLFHVNNYNKKSITLKIQDPRGRDILLDLVAVSDVVIENFACGTMDKWGVGYAACKARNPSIIYASAKGFGETGPMRDRRAFDTVVQALSGIMSVTGDTIGGPVKAGPSVCDLLNAASGAMAVTAAIAARVPGESQFIDCAMFDVGVWSLLSLWPDAFPREGDGPDVGGTESNEFREAGTDTSVTTQPHMSLGALPDECQLTCRDASVVVSGASTVALTTSLGLEVSDHGSDGGRPLADWARSRTALDAASELQALGIAAAPVWSLAQLDAYGLLAARGMVRQHEHPHYGTIPLIESPIARPGFGGDGLWRDQPLLGQHTVEIIGGLLGRTAELRALREAEVIA
jgi:CoA:oxalate CoA-transferase